MHGKDAARISTGSAWLGRGVAFGFTVGCAAAAALPGALPIRGVGFAIVLAGIGAMLARRLRPFGALLVGVGWFWLHAHTAMAVRIDPESQDRVVEVQGRVVGLPERMPDRVRFDLLPEQATLEGRPLQIDGMLRLSLYRDPASIHAGQTLALTVKLRRPRGLRNPGGFDFERLALERRIAAIGHVVAVRSAGDPQQGIDGLRERASAWIAERVNDPQVSALLRALAVGDQGAIPDPLWDRFRSTGTTHLVAISGFHVAMAGAFVAWLVAAVFWLAPGLALRCPRRPSMAVAAILGAGAYALLAGPSLPVLRTVAMIAVAVLSLSMRRHAPPGRALGLAALAVLLPDPLAVLNPGFWLSFAGVFWLLVALGGRSAAPWWQGYVRAQWVAFIALTPLAVAWFQQVSLLGPLVNAVAIPWVSLVLVPLLLLALGLWLLSPAIAETPLELAVWGAQAYLDGLGFAARMPLAELLLPAPSSIAVLLAVVGTAVILLPRGVPGRGLGLALCLPLLSPPIDRPPVGSFDLVTLDVGQGLAVLVRTHAHSLLYDAGPSRPSGMDSGEAIVVPALHALGVRRLDAMVVSHADNDHAGGAASVIRLLAPDRTVGGPGTRMAAPCEGGQSWEWDGVKFEFLHPPAHFPNLGNEGSCVLRVSAGAGAALLPGDVTSLIESRMLRDGAPLRAQVLLLGHHGSRTSSSEEFLRRVRPIRALGSAGYRNRFGHPHPEVVTRLNGLGAHLDQTAEQGAIRLRVAPDGAVMWIEGERLDHRRPWQEP